MTSDDELKGIFTIQSTLEEWNTHHSTWESETPWHEVFEEYIMVKELQRNGTPHYHIAFITRTIVSKDMLRRRIMKILPSLHKNEKGRQFGYNLSFQKKGAAEPWGYVCKEVFNGLPQFNNIIAISDGNQIMNKSHKRGALTWEQELMQFFNEMICMCERECQKYLVAKIEADNNPVRIITYKELLNLIWRNHAAWGEGFESIVKHLVSNNLWVPSQNMLSMATTYLERLRMER